MQLTKENAGITKDTKRTLSEFSKIFNVFLSNCSDSVKHSSEQQSLIADTIIFYLADDGFAGKLPFSYDEAYLSVGIPKEFLR